MQRITAGIPEKDHCPVLTRLKAFIVDQGVVCTLEHTCRDRRTGNPVNLSDYTNTPPDPSRDPPPYPPEGAVFLRVKDWCGVGLDDVNNRVWEIRGNFVNINEGIVEATLNSEIVDDAGIYELSWGIRDRYGDLVFTSPAIMSVERTLFSLNTLNVRNIQGPPTINEIRMWIMDSAPSENFLLDEVEFSDEQILLAITEPVHYWNQTPPHVGIFNTKNFPYREMWLKGIVGNLYEMVAAHYRRNFLQTNGGGVMVADKAKEKEYLSEALRLKKEYQGFVINKKVQINIHNYFGNVVSDYSRLS